MLAYLKMWEMSLGCGMLCKSKVGLHMGDER